MKKLAIMLVVIGGLFLSSCEKKQDCWECTFFTKYENSVLTGEWHQKETSLFYDDYPEMKVYNSKATRKYECIYLGKQ